MPKSTEKKMNILWLGPVFDEITVRNRRAVSPAANRWQRGCLKGLNANQCACLIASHLPEPLFPKGKFWVSKKDASFPSDLHAIPTSYLNVPVLRTASLKLSYIRTLKYLFSRYDFDAVISYNLPKYLPSAMQFVRKRYRTRWISILADMNEEMFQSNLLTKPDGCVFLSWSSYERFKGGPKLHLDGGIEAIPSRPASRQGGKLRVTYTGALNHFAGIDLLLDAWENVNSDKAKLIICGKGNDKDIKRRIERDPSIEFKGLVDKQELHEICQHTDAFINPRPNCYTDNAHNFPSKILEYMKYRKTVISTKTPGISPYYKPHVIFIDEPSSQCLTKAINDFAASPDQYAIDVEATSRFLHENKLWVKQSKKLKDWIRSDLTCN